MDYTLEPARPDDLDALYVVEENSFIDGIRETKEAFLERLEAFPGGCILLRSAPGGDSLGYLCAELWEDIRPPYAASRFELGHSAARSHNADGTLLYISSMGLLPSCRGKGLGKALFNGAVELILKNNPAVSRVILLVNEDWKGARRIYAQAGFAETAEFPAFFAGPDGVPRNGIIMEKNVSGR